MGWTPLFLNAVPHSTGVSAPEMVARLMAATSWSSDGSEPSRYSSIISSSFSAIRSSSRSRHSRAASTWSSGIPTTSYLSPLPSVCQSSARIRTRSMTPRKSDSTPHGSWTTSGVAPSRSVIISTQRWNSAPTRSILFTKQIRGTWYRLAWRHTVSDCGSTPATASKTATAPSRTRRLRSTSTVKSTCPGVSMMLIRCPRQLATVAAEVIVMPLSCQFLLHRFPRTGPRVTHDPAPGQRRAAVGPDLDRHLVGGAADPAGLDLEHRCCILQGCVEDLDGVLLGDLLDAVQGAVDHPLSRAPLAPLHHNVDELSYALVCVHWVRQDDTLVNPGTPRH